MTQPVQLAFATDAGFFEPTVLALVSALGHCPAKTKVIFMGTDLSVEQTSKLREAIAQFDQTDLLYHALSQSDFGEAIPPDPQITLTALARLFLPSIAQGRILYIDGDTLTCGALAPLFEVDMYGHPLAAVRDQHVLRQVYKNKPDLSYFQEIMTPHPATSYFNSGILLMDLDVIKAEPEVIQKMQDFAALEGYRFLDQDHLNRLFAGRVLYLPHRWNSVWGRAKYQSRLWQTLGLPVAETADEEPAIVHFTGPKKPWKKLRLSTLTQSLLIILKYRWAQHRLRHLLKD